MYSEFQQFSDSLVREFADDGPAKDDAEFRALVVFNIAEEVEQNQQEDCDRENSICSSDYWSI